MKGRVFIHAPKTGGTSIRETLKLPTEPYHRRLIDYEDIPLDTFTVIRNPYDRAVSMCAHLNKGVEITPSFFSEWCNNIPSVRLYKKYTVCFADPLIDYIAVDSKIIIKDIIRFEKLNLEFRKLFNMELEHHNKGSRGPYQKYYNESSYTLITDRYKQDITAFNYTFE